ncbi:MAG: pyridoxamine kinase [Clostridia bacterium]
MKNIVPRVAAIHDISGFGRCSLTVIIPVLSAMGIQVCPLPTAILSTHPGGFGPFYFHDFTDSMEEYAAHWKDIGLEFDCVYSCFLASERQIDIVMDFFQTFVTGKVQLIVVDPVMGDHEVLYKTYNSEMQRRMRLLVEKADAITPNLTEACFLLDIPYKDEPMDAEKARSLLWRLSCFGPQNVVVTGVVGEDGRHMNIGYEAGRDLYWKITYDRVPSQYPGTGDIFTGVLVGGLLQRDSFPLAVDRAAQFVSLAIGITYGYGTPEKEGVLLEKVLNHLGGLPGRMNYEVLE